MTRIGLIAIAIMAAPAGAALASADQTAPADEPADAPKPERKPEKKICRTDRMTGTLTRSTRLCMTQTQWDQVADRTNKALNDLIKGTARGDLKNASRPGQQ